MKSHFRLLHCSVSEILVAVFAWSLLILRFGYRYGTADQVELLPYTLFLHNPLLYTSDFFIQGLHASVPNERTFAAYLLLPFVNYLELSCFILQFLSTTILVLGLVKLACFFIRNQFIASLAVLLALIPFNNFSLGAVGLYSECFQASALSVAIVAWALYFFLNKKYLVVSIAMSCATFVQLLDGLDVMMVLCTILLFEAVAGRVSWQTLMKFTGIYTFSAGVYLLLVFLQKNVEADITSQQLFQILFEFRHPHHYIFSSFSKFRMMVFFLLVLFSLPYFYLKSRVVFRFICLGLAGVVFYALAVDVFKSVFIANFQFYQITPWLKFFAVVAGLGFSCAVINFSAPVIQKSVQWLSLVSLSVITWVVILFFHHWLPYQVPYQIFSMKSSDDMISICQQIKESTPPHAVFIQPFENTELKFYAQRSSFVDFKANVRNKLFVKKWANRLQLVYGISSDSFAKGFALQSTADSFFYSLSSRQIATLKSKGVTHVLTSRKVPFSSGTLILANHSYAVYQL